MARIYVIHVRKDILFKNQVRQFNVQNVLQTASSANIAKIVWNVMVHIYYNTGSVLVNVAQG